MGVFFTVLSSLVTWIALLIQWESTILNYTGIEFQKVFAVFDARMK
jgi:hypothetical protein